MSEDLNELVKVGQQLADRLERMSWDEKRFGWQVGDQLEKLAYSCFCMANDLAEIASKTVGGRV